MSQKVTIKRENDEKTITNLFQYYIYDMSEYTGFSPNLEGTYAVADSISKLSDYWTRTEHYPYLILVDGEIAGFSLVRRYPLNPEYFDVGQFFVLRKFKRMGVGKRAFKLSVSKHPGKWITRVLLDNKGAFDFWKKVISEVSNDCYIINEEKYFDKDMNFIYYSIGSNNE